MTFAAKHPICLPMSLRIASWNINSVRARLPLVEKLLQGNDIDVLCLQETKCQNQEFPVELFNQLGYRHHNLVGQRMHHGVAILSRVPFDPLDSADWQANGEARHAAVRLPGGVILNNVYIPAGGDIPDREANPKFGQKLDFLARMTDWSGALKEPTILLGDFNIAPHAEDVWSHKALVDVVSHTEIEIKALDDLQQSHGWIDLGRKFTPLPEKLFTWWSYRARDWAKSNRGRRLDHIWVSPELRANVRDCQTLVDARGWERPSDHVPLIAEFEF